MRGNRDLRQVVLLALVCAVGGLFLPFDALRLVVAAPLLFFLPGYAIVAAIFAHGRLPRPQLLTLSAGLSLAVLALGALLINYLPGGVRSGWWALLLVLVTIGAARAAAVRRPRQGGNRQRARRPRPGALQLAMVGAGAVATVAAIVLAFQPLGAKSAVGYTELWIQPLKGAKRGVQIGVGSAEQEDTTYRLWVKFGRGEPPQGRYFGLAPGETKIIHMLTEKEPTVPQPVRATLFRRDQPGHAYRRVTTWIRPRGGSG
jgi:hypothetical protein